MSDRLPWPPPLHGTPTTRTVPPGRWWRVHPWDPSTGLHGPCSFNASGRGNARFSPLPDVPPWVPTLYAAGTLEAALMETALHDVPTPSEGHIHDLDRTLAAGLAASAIHISTPLQVVDLTQLGLKRMGLPVSQLFETNADDYPRTRAWALWLRAALPQAQGLLWMSARHAEVPALVLFGDRVADGAIVQDADTATRPLHDAAVCQTLLGLLDRLGCGVAPAR